MYSIMGSRMLFLCVLIASLNCALALPIMGPEVDSPYPMTACNATSCTSGRCNPGIRARQMERFDRIQPRNVYPTVTGKQANTKEATAFTAILALFIVCAVLLPIGFLWGLKKARGPKQQGDPDVVRTDFGKDKGLLAFPMRIFRKREKATRAPMRSFSEASDIE